MADLADPDPRTYSQQAQALHDYHVRLLALMEAELGDDPGEAQARKIEEMARFREAAGIGTRSTAIWAN